MEMKSKGISAVGFHDRSEIEETHQWSPTHEQVEAYIRWLEWRGLQKDLGTPLCHAEENREAGRSGRPFTFWLFFWGLIALALGCFAWLLQIIYEGLK